MRRYDILVAVITAISFAACQTGGKDSIDSSLLPDSGKKITAPTTNTDAHLTDSTAIGAQNVPATQQPQTTSTTASGMNPPHGQPDHRCDIAVGAPLNAPIKKVDLPVAAPIQKIPMPKEKR